MALLFSDKVQDMSTIQRTKAKRDWEWVSETLIFHPIKHPLDIPIL